MRAILSGTSLLLGVAVTISLFCRHSAADIGIFGGAGETVLPVGSSDIRMTAEKVTMVVGPPGKGGGFDGLPLVQVKTQFTFENETDKSVTVQMGFPDQQGRVPGEQEPRSLIEKLAVRSNGVPLRVERKKSALPQDSSLPEYEQVYIWSSSFAPREKKQVELSYVIRMSAFSEFDLAEPEIQKQFKLSRREKSRILRFYREILPLAYRALRDTTEFEDEGLVPDEGQLEMVQSGFLVSTGYLLRTGALWKGTIGQAYIELDLTQFLKSADPLRVPLPENGKLDGYTVALIKPGGFHWQGAKLIWEMTDFEPAEDIQVGFLTVFYIPRDAAMLRQWLRSKDGAKLSKSTLTMLKECVLALHGKTTTDPLLKTFFDNSMPYLRGKHYPSKTIPRTAQEIIAEIDRALTPSGVRRP